MDWSGVERKLQAVVNAIRRTSLTLGVIAAGLGLLAWVIVRHWLDGSMDIVGLVLCLVPAIAFGVLPLLVNRLHRRARELVGSLRGQGERARAELPRLQTALDNFQRAKRWSRFTAGRRLLGELHTARTIVTDVTDRAVDIQVAGAFAGWSFAVGFIGLLALIFTIPVFAIARVFS